MKNHLKRSLVAIVMLLSIISIVFVSCKKEEISDQEIQFVYDEMSKLGLISNMTIEQFVDNVNSSSQKMNIVEDYSYNSDLDQTTASISIVSISGTVNDVSGIYYIPKEVASSVNDITFLPEPTKIINPDPVIMWHVTEIDSHAACNWKAIFKGKFSESVCRTFILSDYKFEFSAGIIYGDFGVTSEKYFDYEDREEIILDLFGPDYQVADWNDLVNYNSVGGDLLELFDELGLTDKGISVLIYKDGNAMYNSNRYYVASRHEHDKPSSYLAHENIDNYLISLGSWYDQKQQILVIKKEK